MRITVQLRPSSPQRVGWNYPVLLRGALYNAMKAGRADLSQQIHDRGFILGTKAYKLITFSRLLGDGVRANSEGLDLCGDFLWHIASPVPPLLEAVATGLLQERIVRLGTVSCTVVQVELQSSPKLPGSVLLRTLSPIVVSTAERRNERLWKRYLAPEEPAFRRILDLNARRKAELILNRTVDQPFTIQVLNARSRFFRLEHGAIRAWEMRMRLSGDPAALTAVYDAGLGERNASGFGMVELISLPPHSGSSDTRTEAPRKLSACFA